MVLAELCKSVQWSMYWVKCHWFSATWMETLAIPFQISTGELYLQKLLQIQGQTAEQETCFLRSTFGCGATGVRFHVRFLLQTPKLCCRSEFKRAAATMKRQREARLDIKARNDDWMCKLYSYIGAYHTRYCTRCSTQYGLTILIYDIVCTMIHNDIYCPTILQF